MQLGTGDGGTAPVASGLTHSQAQIHPLHASPIPLCHIPAASLLENQLFVPSSAAFGEGTELSVASAPAQGAQGSSARCQAPFQGWSHGWDPQNGTAKLPWDGARAWMPGEGEYHTGPVFFHPAKHPWDGARAWIPGEGQDHTGPVFFHQAKLPLGWSKSLDHSGAAFFHQAKLSLGWSKSLDAWGGTGPQWSSIFSSIIKCQGCFHSYSRSALPSPLKLHHH